MPADTCRGPGCTGKSAASHRLDTARLDMEAAGHAVADLVDTTIYAPLSPLAVR